MNLKLLKIRYENIRDFKKLELDFTTQDLIPHHISLVQMPNGTGKTTTITLLRKTLSGGEFESGDIKSFKPTTFSADNGIFEMDLLFEGDPFTIGLKFDYVGGSFNYYHSKPSREKGGIEPGHRLPQQIRHVFSEPFINLFIFDGELSKQMLNNKETKAEVAIRSIYFLDRLQRKLNHVDEICEERVSKASDNTSVKTEQGLKGLITQKKKVEECLDWLKEQEKKHKRDIHDKKQKLEEKKTQKENIIKEKEDLVSKYNQLDSKIKALETERENNAISLLNHFRKPSFFSKKIRSNLELLVTQMKNLKLPKSTSIEFFKELAEGVNCVCGREIDEDTKIEILKNAEKFLSEEDISIQNAIKNHLRNLPDFSSVDFYITQIGELQKKLRLNQQGKDALQEKLDPKSKEKAEKITEEIQALEKEIEDAEFLLESYTSNDKTFYDEYAKHINWQNNIPLCEEYLSNLKNNIHVATDTVEFGNKADLLKVIIEEIINRGLDSLKDSIIERANERIYKILGNDEVSISKIDRSIFIHNKESVSEGQSLSVGYAFLSTLFEQSLFKVPFVVDSPAVSIDFEVRREVAEMVPSLFDQMIVFIISSERGGFVDGLNSERGIQYYTVRKIGDLNDTGKVEVSLDKEFFMGFQSEEESEN